MVTAMKNSLTEEELTELAGDLAKEGLRLSHSGRRKKGETPEGTLITKMEELLDIGDTLNSAEENLTVSATPQP